MVLSQQHTKLKHFMVTIKGNKIHSSYMFNRDLTTVPNCKQCGLKLQFPYFFYYNSGSKVTEQVPRCYKNQHTPRWFNI